MAKDSKDQDTLQARTQFNESYYTRNRRSKRYYQLPLPAREPKICVLTSFFLIN